MSPQSKKGYRKTLGLRYQKASRKQKSQILNEVCTNLGFNRKYAVRWSRNFKPSRRRKSKHKPGPKPKYQHPDFLKALKEIWIATNLICSKRLKESIPHWIGPYQQLFGYLPPEILGKLLKISPSTIDQALKPIRTLYRGEGRCTTKPGLLLKHHIPIKTNQWDESRPPVFLKRIPWPTRAPRSKAITPSLPIPSISLPTGASNAPPTAKDSATLPTRSKTLKNPYPSPSSASTLITARSFSTNFS